MKAISVLLVLLVGVPAFGDAPTSAPATASSRHGTRNVLVIAHRGNSVVYTENTLSAFSSAFAVGAGMVEADIRLTRDGVPVVFHDDVLELTTTARGPVAEKTLAELRAIKAGSLRDETATETIPTLEELLLLARNKGRVLLDIKTDGMAPAIAAMMARLGLRQDMIAVGTWNDAQAAEYRQHLPDAELLNTQGAPPNWDTEFVASRRAAGVDVFELASDNVPPGFVAAAHARGIRVYVYTLNTGAEMEKMIALGVDGIETDIPELLVHLLHAHPRAR